MWGLGQNGELGLGREVEEQEVPGRVRCGELDEMGEEKGNLKGKGWKWVVEDVSTGGQHTLIVARQVE